MTSQGIPGVVTKDVSGSVEETVTRILAKLADGGVKVFAVIDHSGEAERAGLVLRDTRLIPFGNPKAGTPVMATAPLAALDLPLKLLVWDDGGQTRISYISPRALASRYRIADELVAPLEVIETLTDQLVGA